MALVKVKPTSPGRRALVKVVHPELHKGKPRCIPRAACVKAARQAVKAAFQSVLRLLAIVLGHLGGFPRFARTRVADARLPT